MFSLAWDNEEVQPRHCRDSKQARREAVELGVGRRSTYKMDNNGKRIAKGARLSVPGSRFDGAQVSLLSPPTFAESVAVQAVFNTS